MSLDDDILAKQGGIVLEIDRAQTFRAGEDGLLHFRVRNLRDEVGRLTLRIEIPGVALLSAEQSIQLAPGCLRDIRFPLFAERHGEKLVQSLDVRLELGGRSRRLVLPDHSVTFQVAAADGSGGSGIVLQGDVSYDFRGHIGDVVIQNMVRRQDDTHPALATEDWQALQLVGKPLDGRLIVQAPRNYGLRDLVLVGSERHGGQEQRAFLFARRELCFGLKHRKGTQDVPLVLRRLPCRSRAEDPENWSRNAEVSQLHGRFALQDEFVCVLDESLNGTTLGRSRLLRGAWECLPERFTLAVPASSSALVLAGRVHRAAPGGRELALSLPADAHMGESLGVGAEYPHEIEALSLRREGNVQEHQYVQVFRSARWGSQEDCAIRIGAEHLEPVHAEVVFYRGEWFLRRLAFDSPAEVNDRALEAEEYVSLAPGKSITLGTATFAVRACSADLLTQV